MPKIDNRNDKNFYNAKRISLIDADVQVLQKKQMEKYQSMEHPSYEDRRHQAEQREEGIKLFNSGMELSLDELKAKGYYVKQQYLIEKRRSDAAKMAYQAGIDHFTNGKAISEANEIYQKNVDFLRGYKEALEKSQTNNKTR